MGRQRGRELIFRCRPKASCLVGRLSSNVRPRRESKVVHLKAKLAVSALAVRRCRSRGHGSSLHGAARQGALAVAPFPASARSPGAKAPCSTVGGAWVDYHPSRHDPGSLLQGLTPRSSGAPTAGHQARAGGTRYIVIGPGLASCRRRPLSANVRRQRTAPQRTRGKIPAWRQP